MATLVLSAVGAAVGANVGGAVLGMSGMVIGRAVGATLGRVIDQRVLGIGSGAVDHGRIERLRVTGAGEGVALPVVWGRMRVAGHVIWASNFEETPGRSRRTKGGLGPRVTEETRYTISVAIALCEGEITGLGRIWAYGKEISREDLNLRLYRGTADQAVDPMIEAVEGAGNAPAYRGTAYVVIEDLDLGPWGNRLPSFAFEVLRAAQAPGALTLQEAVRAVAWMPGSGEYALATEPVLVQDAPAPEDAGWAAPMNGLPAFDATGEARQANANSPSGLSDFETALNMLREELPRVQSGLLIVSWFGDDLRCGVCRIRPKVEYSGREGTNQPWRVSGLTRDEAQELARVGDDPVYGGTPSDVSVMQAIAAMQSAGQKVVYYPFILMEQLEENGLPDPWTGADDQPPLPWRGRITLSQAPGRDGSPDRTVGAEAEVAAFFGTAEVDDFVIGDGRVDYTGPDEWRYRRFILHQAALCAAAGGVDAFCIGSEMVALMHIRGAEDSFPAVTQMIALLRDVRAILGPDVKLTYAADWSEYFGYDDGVGNRYFHLDPLWADDDTDFIGIDNYMPLSDWRDGEGHRDDAEGGWRSIHDLAYLKANVAGGEGFDWYYTDDHARAVQERTPITDGLIGEDWIWRYKDLRAWWENPHFERRNGVRALEATDWEPRSKPVWFTELGCAAIDKGTNQPNKFLDPKSSESAIPYFSNGYRDDLIQMQYLRAMAAYWTDPANNPRSPLYDGSMLDWDRAHVWAWDARPFPWFPGNRTLWNDGENWARGHWITGRSMHQPLSAVVAEICERAGLRDYDVSALYGVVRGYGVASTDTGRAALQPLMLAHGFEALEREGRLIFRMRDGRVAGGLTPEMLVARAGGDLETTRAAQPETVGRVRLNHIEAEGDFEIRAAEAVYPDEASGEVAQSELAMLLSAGEARTTVRRWMAEARIARDVARFSLPPSSSYGVGDVVTLLHGGALRHYRIDRMELTGAREIEAVRIEPGVYRGSDPGDDAPAARRHEAMVPVTPVFMDLPLMRGDELPHAPHLAISARPWPGAVAVYDAPIEGGDFALNATIAARAAIGRAVTPLHRAKPALWTRGDGLEVAMPVWVTLASLGEGAVLGGGNVMAIGNGAEWELFQFAQAELIAPGRWRLSRLLRGQFGTDAMMPQSWAPGAAVVRVDAALSQIDVPQALRGLARRYRIGPAARPLDDALYTARVEAFQGVGLRPYAPAFLTAERVAPGGDLAIRWVRRTRIGGDDWTALDVPLGEESERYLLRISAGGTVLREEVLTAAEWLYTATAQAADGAEDEFTVSVAQVSAVYGAGLFAQASVADG